MKQYVDLAKRVAARWPMETGVFVGGSLLRGQGGLHSDIDMVVLLPKVEAPCRYWLRAEGVPFDIFHHDIGTLRHYIMKDVDERRPVLLHLLAHAHLLGDVERLLRWQAWANWRFDFGPRPLAPREWMLRRYVLMTELEDLYDAHGAERRAVEARLRELLFTTLCDRRGVWRGTGKWLARWAYIADAELAAAIESEDIGLIGQKILDDIGGPLVEEWRDEAPAITRR